MPAIDLSFPLRGEYLPADHGYLLYAAVSRLLPAAHAAEASPGREPAGSFGIHPIRGRQLGGRTLQLTEHSRLVIRADAEQIARFLPLAGKQLRTLDRSICLGVPEVRALAPAPALRSRMVTIKLPDVATQSGDGAAELFRAAALRKLAELGIHTESPRPPHPQAGTRGQGEGQVPPRPPGEGRGEGGLDCSSAHLTLGKRRTLRIKDKEVVGYEVVVEGLTAAESITLQETGLGGRRHMGCGIFSPLAVRGEGT
jgi:CRISPR-associated protein Cas6